MYSGSFARSRSRNSEFLRRFSFLDSKVGDQSPVARDRPRAPAPPLSRTAGCAARDRFDLAQLDAETRESSLAGPGVPDTRRLHWGGAARGRRSCKDGRQAWPPNGSAMNFSAVNSGRRR